MIRRDWFERQAQMLAQAICVALGFKAKGDIEAAASTIETAVHRLFGMDPKLALGLPLQEFLGLAFRGEEPSSDMLLALSKLFMEWGLILDSKSKTADASSARDRAKMLEQLSKLEVKE